MSTHNLCFHGDIRKHLFLYSPYFEVYFPLTGALAYSSAQSGPSLSAYLVFTYATKIPCVVSQYLYKPRPESNHMKCRLIQHNQTELHRESFYSVQCDKYEQPDFLIT